MADVVGVSRVLVGAVAPPEVFHGAASALDLDGGDAGDGVVWCGLVLELVAVSHLNVWFVGEVGMGGLSDREMDVHALDILGGGGRWASE